MKNLFSINFRLNRPKECDGKADKYLSKIMQELAQFLRKTQKEFKHVTLHLTVGHITELAQVLVEFAEDVCVDVGIWRSLEGYNTEYFGTPLPFIVKPAEPLDARSINKQRVHYLLWNQYEMMLPELIVSPQHRDLLFLAEKTADFLNDKFQKIPQNSSVKTFFNQPVQYGWDVKRKLIWLGKHSYLFRQCYHAYISRNGGKPETAIIDDFICQESTCWSGLGVIDILSSILTIDNMQRHELRLWYEKHTAVYKVLSKKGACLSLLNIINEKPYTVRVGEDMVDAFEIGQVLYGSVVPWDGEWYWSGVQHSVGNPEDDVLQNIKKTFLRTTATIPFRYCKDLKNKALESLKENFGHFLAYHHGRNLVVYSNGKSMAKEFQYYYDAYTKHRRQLLGIPENGDNNKFPDFQQTLPPHLLESQNGIGVFFNPSEGLEIMQNFSEVLNGFRKKGNDLTINEQKAILGFINSNSISPQFVSALVQEHGAAAIASIFFIATELSDGYFLEYLLRKHKGHYYRKRYPAINFIS